MSTPEEMMGASEVCALLGFSRQRLTQLRQADFPEPAVRLKAGAVWRKADVVRWAREKGRELHE